VSDVETRTYQQQFDESKKHLPNIQSCLDAEQARWECDRPEYRLARSACASALRAHVRRICLRVFLTMRQPCGSPFTSEAVYAFACSKEMCGGSGGTSGSATISSSTGRALLNARSHAGAICSGLSTRIASNPSSSA